MSLRENSSSEEKDKLQNWKQVSQHVEEALKKLQYGSIEIVVHDSKIVQIEKKEKTRFT